MGQISNEIMLIYGLKHVKLDNYSGAIEVFYKILQSNPDDNIKMRAFSGLGDALRGEYEIELAEKMYEKAIKIAQKLKNSYMIEQLEYKLENVYIYKKDRDLNPIQIGFFMRSIMKLLSYLGKTDWF